MNFFSFIILAAFVFMLSDTASAQFWKRSEEEKAEKPERVKTETAKAISPNATAAAGEPQQPAVPVIPPTPPRIDSAVRTLKTAQISNVQPLVGLETITSTQRELELLASRYEDLRRGHEEQLISLRALASQAKIHSQLLDGIKAQFSVSAGASAAPPSLDASSLEKYRLIRERMSAQQQVLKDMTETQDRLRDLLSTTRIPTAPPAIKLPPNPRVAASSSLDVIKGANQLKVTESVLESAKDAKARAEAEQKEKEKGETA